MWLNASEWVYRFISSVAQSLRHLSTGTRPPIHCWNDDARITTTSAHSSVLLKSEQRQRKPCRGTSAMDEPKLLFKYEQQIQQLYTFRGTHGTVSHTLQHRACQLSFIVSSSLPTYDSQGVVPHTSKQKYINDLVK